MVSVLSQFICYLDAIYYFSGLAQQTRDENVVGALRATLHPLDPIRRFISKRR